MFLCAVSLSASITVMYVHNRSYGLDAFLAMPNWVSVKPRPHQQQCRSNIVEATGNNVERCFDIVAGVDVVLLFFVVTARRYASAVYAAALSLCVRLSVRLSPAGIVAK